MEKKNRQGQTRLIYLLAASHSGSTLLAMLLNAHPDVCTVGELKATSLGDPSRYRCSCQQLISDCPFWNGIREDMAAKGFDFDISKAGTDIRSESTPYIRKLLQPLHRGSIFEMFRDVALNLSPVWRRNLPEILAKNKAFIDCVAARTGKKVIVDSSKIGIRLKYLMRIPNLDIRVIRAIRDGRGVALTYMDPACFADAQKVELRQGGHGGDRADERLSMREAAREWRRSNEEAEAILKRLKSTQFFESRYETLCESPNKVLIQIFSFIGVDPGKKVTDFRSVEHHIVGNGMRLDSGNKIQLDERWRENLSRIDISQFDAEAGEMLFKLGYQ